VLGADVTGVCGVRVVVVALNAGCPLWWPVAGCRLLVAGAVACPVGGVRVLGAGCHRCVSRSRWC